MSNSVPTQCYKVTARTKEGYLAYEFVVTAAERFINCDHKLHELLKSDERYVLTYKSIILMLARPLTSV